MAEKLAGKSRTIEDCCPDLLYARLLTSLKDVFNHDDFKSKLQEQAVKKVATSKYFLGRDGRGIAILITSTTCYYIIIYNIYNIIYYVIL